MDTVCYFSPEVSANAKAFINDMKTKFVIIRYLRWLKTVFCFFGDLSELGAVSKACNCSVLNDCFIFLR